VLNRSKNWQALTLEDFFGGIYHKVLCALGVESLAPGYDIIEEEVTYEIVTMPVKKEE